VCPAAGGPLQNCVFWSDANARNYKKTASKLAKNIRCAAKKQCFSVRNTRQNPSSNFGLFFCAFLCQQVFVLIYVVYVFGVGRAMEVRVGYLAKVSRGAEHIFVLATHSARIFLEPDLVIGKLPENLHNLQFREMNSRCSLEQPLLFVSVKPGFWNSVLNFNV